MLSGCSSLKQLKEDSTYAAEFTSGKHPIGIGQTGHIDPKILEEQQKCLDKINTEAEKIDFNDSIDIIEAEILAKKYWINKNGFNVCNINFSISDKTIFWQLNNDWMCLYIDKVTGGIEEVALKTDEIMDLRRSLENESYGQIYQDPYVDINGGDNPKLLFATPSTTLSNRPKREKSERVMTKQGEVYVGMSKWNLYRIFSPLEQVDYYRKDNEEWITFNNIAIEAPDDLIVFYLLDNEVQGWREEIRKDNLFDGLVVIW